MYNTNEYIEAYGSLIQNGVNWMAGVNAFADEFLQQYNTALPELQTVGHSEYYTNWHRENATQIIELYEYCKQNNLIPENG